MVARTKYEYAVNELRERIGASCKDGDLLPSESELAETFSVSVATVRKALDILVHDGVLEKRQGRRAAVRRISPKPENSKKRLGTVLLIWLEQRGFSQEEAVELQRQLFHAGFATAFCTIGSLAELPSVEELKGVLDAYYFDGLICGPMMSRFDVLAPAFEDVTRPMVFIKNRDPIPANFVTVDMGAGIYAAAKHLRQIGCRNIRHYGNPDDKGTWGKLPGIVRFLQDCQPDVSMKEFVVPAIGTMESGYETLLREFAAGRVPDGILAHNDSCALGIMLAAKELGVRIPNDLALVGFDDVADALAATPPLTTVRQPKEQIAREAISLLTEAIAHPSNAFRQRVVLEPTLVIRDTTLGFARAGRGQSAGPTPQQHRAT